MEHYSVLHAEISELMRVRPGESVLDCTLGLGGHSEIFLESSSPDGKLTGLDADSQNLAEARKTLLRFGDRVEFIHMNFLHLADLDPEQKFDVIFADLGVSSPHFDDPERGFSFRFDGPLDLRFDRTSGKTAAQVLERISEDRLATALKLYGEVPPYALAREIKRANPQTTFDLVECAQRVFSFKAKSYMAQIFQALRMLVNHEQDALASLLTVAPNMLKAGGRFGVISFHSLEDRAVKRAFASLCADEIDDVTGSTVRESDFVLLTKKPVMPTESECEENPRSRSAKFRLIQRRV